MRNKSVPPERPIDTDKQRTLWVRPHFQMFDGMGCLGKKTLMAIPNHQSHVRDGALLYSLKSLTM